MHWDAEVFVGKARSLTAARRAVKESDLDEERLVDIFDRIRLFGQRSGESVQSHGATLIFLDDGQEQLAIDLVESVLVHFEHFEGGLCGSFVDLARTPYLRVIAHSPQQSVRYPWCSASPACYLACSGCVNGDADYLRGPLHDDGQIIDGVKL